MNDKPPKLPAKTDRTCTERTINTATDKTFSDLADNLQIKHASAPDLKHDGRQARCATRSLVGGRDILPSRGWTLTPVACPIGTWCMWMVADAPALCAVDSFLAQMSFPSELAFTGHGNLVLSRCYWLGDQMVAGS